MKTLDELRAERDAKRSELKAIEALIDAELGKTLVRCETSSAGKGCGMAMQINELEFIQTRWYEGPHGCSGGDHWHQGEGQFVCIHCGTRNRLYGRKAIQDLKYKFKSIVEEHKR